MVEKRKRGRPQGSGKNDDQTLMRVARKMVRDASLKPTTAMWRVINEHRDRPETDETLLRRLQVKWRAHGAEYLARARREMQPARAMTVAEAIAAMVPLQNFRVADMPVLTEIHEMMANAQRGLKAAFASPEMLKAIEGFKAQQEQMRVTLNSPEIKRMMKAMEEQKQEWAKIARSIDFDQLKRVAIDMPKYTIQKDVIEFTASYPFPTK